MNQRLSDLNEVSTSPSIRSKNSPSSNQHQTSPPSSPCPTGPLATSCSSSGSSWYQLWPSYAWSGSTSTSGRIPTRAETRFPRRHRHPHQQVKIFRRSRSQAIKRELRCRCSSQGTKMRLRRVLLRRFMNKLWPSQFMWIQSLLVECVRGVGTSVVSTTTISLGHQA